jgi:hypothetical protein
MFKFKLRLRKEVRKLIQKAVGEVEEVIKNISCRK